MAMMFPALMIMIVGISMLTASARIEQALQSTANRAARAAALCCHYTGEPNDGAAIGAQAVVRASLTSAVADTALNRVRCTNDLVADSNLLFFDVADNLVPIGNNVVPPGGEVHVILRCRVPVEVLAGFGLPGINAERHVAGVASIDPYRSRLGG